MQERQGVTMATSKQEHSLLQILQERFTSLENVRTLAIDSNRELLSFLLESSEFRERFFTRIDSVAVFEKDKFLDFLKLRVLSKSYTAYGNKIGLQLESSFETTSKVVLNFPFKDCILKGGQSRDEQKSKEIFFNEVLEKSEIDVLFSKKMLHNFELIECQDSFPKSAPTNRTNERTNERTKRQLKECLKAGANLLIKGNNLLALHSLKKKFANKVKLIYIDPPYNTNSSANTFSYNNNFNHSTWLTFMKNRAEIAREFLLENGFFVCAIDHCELFYVGVLLDEIFGRENRIGIVSVETNPRGRADSEFLATSNEFFIIYAKNINYAKINDLSIDEALLEDYKLEDDISKYKLTPLKRTGSNSTPDKRPNLYFPLYFNPYSNEIATEPMENFIEILPNGVNEKKVWRWSKEKIKNSLSELEAKEVKGEYSIFVKDRIKFTKKAKTFWSNPKYDAATNGTQYLQKFNLNSIFSYPKSIFLMEDIIRLLTSDNDLIMDYHAGSGTTAEAIINLNRLENSTRRFILIEQMDYIESITKERLKKVVSGEQGGISKAVGWSGGGSFIYCELMPLNAVYKERIKNLACHTDLERSEREVSKNAESKRDFSPTAQNDKEVEKELEKLYKELESKAFVDYRVDIQDMLKDKEFHALSLEDKLKVLYAILDSNMDYVLYDDIDDSEYGVSKELKELNRIFYGDNDE